MSENIWHVIPINDLKEHNQKTVLQIGLPCCLCECEPVINQEVDGLVVIHNSFDGREGVEWTKEILNAV